MSKIVVTKSIPHKYFCFISAQNLGDKKNGIGNTLSRYVAVVALLPFLILKVRPAEKSNLIHLTRKALELKFFGK